MLAGVRIDKAGKAHRDAVRVIAELLIQLRNRIEERLRAVDRRGARSGDLHFGTVVDQRILDRASAVIENQAFHSQFPPRSFVFPAQFIHKYTVLDYNYKYRRGDGKL